MRTTAMRIALAASLLLMTEIARADIADMLGITKAAENAGRKAAEEVVRGADLATRNLAMMTNQFGQLIDDFYGGDAAKANKARKILEGVFGRSLTNADNVKLQVTAAFEGNVVPADRLEVDLWLFPNVDNESLKSIAGAGASFLGTSIKAAVPPGTTLEVIRANVLGKAKAFHARDGGTDNDKNTPPTRADDCAAKFPLPRPNRSFADMTMTPVKRDGVSQKKYEECLADMRALDLTEVVMASFSIPNALTTQGTVTRDLPGGRFVAVVANKQAIEKLRDRLKITFWVHQAGDTQKRIGAFREVVRTIDPADMLRNVVPTPLKATPELCYVFVDLKLDAIMGTAYLTTTGGK